MMAIVRATCEECGDVVFRHDHAKMFVYLYPDESVAYKYICPSCEVLQLTVCNLETAQLLEHIGVPVMKIDLAQDTVKDRAESQITVDEQIDFHTWLEANADNLVELAEGGGTAN